MALAFVAAIKKSPTIFWTFASYLLVFTAPHFFFFTPNILCHAVKLASNVFLFATKLFFVVTPCSGLISLLFSAVIPSTLRLLLDITFFLCTTVSSALMALAFVAAIKKSPAIFWTFASYLLVFTAPHFFFFPPNILCHAVKLASN